MIDRNELCSLILETVGLDGVSDDTKTKMIVADILLHYDLTEKPKPIEPGCKVRWTCDQKCTWTVIGIYRDRAWIDCDSDDDNLIIKIDDLTRID